MDRKCKLCGGKHEFEKSKCPAFGKTCKRPNHFANVCYAAKDNDEEKCKVHCLENKCADSNNESENKWKWVNVLKSTRCTMNNAKQVSCAMSVGNRIVKFQSVTGWTTNIIPVDFDTNVRTTYTTRKTWNDENYYPIGESRQIKNPQNNTRY